MPQQDAYMLRIWRSRAVSGQQWVARLEHLPEGESRRFGDPEALLAYLGTVVGRMEDGAPPAPRPAIMELPASRTPEEGEEKWTIN